MRGRVIFIILVTLLAGLLCLGAGCAKKEVPPTAEKVLKVGIIQIAEHPSLDMARQGFLDVLKEKGYEEGKNLTVDYQNAQGDPSTANTIAQKFVADKVDLVLAIATPAAQAMAKATKDIPILITAVTDPVAAGLAESLEKPGTNVTGTTDMNPVKDQLALLKEICPEAKNVGVLYNTSEKNSEVQVEIAEKVAPELGVKIIKAVATSSAEVLQAANSLVGKVDAFYVPTDNTVVSALDSVIKVAEEHDIPLIVGEGDSVKKGGLATLGIDYYTLGKQTADIALRIWERGEKPENIPIEGQKEYKLIVNLKAAEAMGVKVPEAVVKRAAEVIR